VTRSPLDKILPRYKQLEPYQGVDSLEILAQQSGISPDKIIRLNGNENLYGPSPKVTEALATFQEYNLYTDPLQRRLRQALSSYVGIGPEWIVAGNGSDEIIDLLVRLFVAPGQRVVVPTPTFGMYAFCAKVNDGEVVSIPRDELYDIDVDAVRAAIGPKAKLVFACSPNNPTGNVTSVEKVKALLKTGVVVAVDETYHEFCGRTRSHPKIHSLGSSRGGTLSGGGLPDMSGQVHSSPPPLVRERGNKEVRNFGMSSMLPLVKEYPNLVVLRTFSKWAGLAGLRVGFGVMSPDVAQVMLTMKPPYNVNAAAEIAVIASLQDKKLLLERVKAVVKERERMFSLLKTVPGVKPWPSEANFILCQLPTGQGKNVAAGLAQHGIFVRYFDTPRLRDCIRISVGLPHHTDALVTALKKVLNEKNS
jgi:histidinol-phosphate aminotransferase